MSYKPPPKTCSTCLNFEELYQDVDGECTRYPEWVDVETTHHCGEFRFNLIIQKEINDNKRAGYDFSDMHLEG